jgi:hypothetical protein
LIDAATAAPVPSLRLKQGEEIREIAKEIVDQEEGLWLELYGITTDQ